MYLKQSTTVNVLLGPFVDATDGVSEETGLAGTMTVKVSKAGAAQANRNSATAITHDALGYYIVELDATDTNTVGIIRVFAHASGTHVAVFHTYFVLSGTAYDAMIGSGVPDVNVQSIDNNAITAASINSEAITAAKIQDNSITAAKIQTDAITASQIAADAIGASELAAGAVNEIRDAILSDSTPFAGADIATIEAKTSNLPVRLAKNVARADFAFTMYDTSGDELTAGPAVTAQRRLGSATTFTAMANTPTHTANGCYIIDLDAADTNADTGTYRFTASGAAPLQLNIVFNP